MAKITSPKDVQDICNMHSLGVTWGSIAIIKGVDYQHLMKTKSDKKSLLFKQLTIGTKVKGSDLATGVIVDIALNGQKDSDRLNACKLMTESDVGSEDDIKTDDNIRHDILIDLRVK